MMNPKVDLYLEEGCGRCSLYRTPECKVHSWSRELNLLRVFVLDCGLTEELKWSQPCYTFNGKNVVIVTAFKEYASLAFFKGVLLQDKAKVLHAPGENSFESRQFKFTDPSDVLDNEALIKQYIYEAIEIEKAGIKVPENPNKKIDYPAELSAIFQEQPDVKLAFESLTPGRKRGYLLHFTSAKQSATRSARIAKMIPKILAGKGFHDR